MSIQSCYKVCQDIEIHINQNKYIVNIKIVNLIK